MTLRVGYPVHVGKHLGAYGESSTTMAEAVNEIVLTNVFDAAERLSTSMGGPSKSERAIGDFLLADPGRTSRMSAREIAEATGTSPATVSRFARSMGYASLAELKSALMIAASEEARRPPVRRVSINQTRDSIDFVLERKIAELTETAQAIDEESLRTTVKLMLRASTVLITGVGNSGTIASNACYKFSLFGVRATTTRDAEMAALAAGNLTPSDLVIMLTTSGESASLMRVMDAAEENYVPVVIVTDNPLTELSQRATRVLRTCTHDNDLIAGDVPFSQMGMYFVIELLFLFLVESGAQARESYERQQRRVGFDRISLAN